jgi:ABC-type dipeptide/oligopeptide/nickel transport system permease subunit
MARAQKVEGVTWDGRSGLRGEKRQRWRQFWRRFSHNKLAGGGLVLVFMMFFTGIFAPWLAPYSYTAQNLDAVEQMPSWEHPLGTDELGRDQLSRIIWGARTATIIAPTATFFSVSLGLLFGLLAGYYRGRVETVVMRLADILFAFPGILLAILIAATVQGRIEAWLKGFQALEGFVKAGFAQVLVVIIALSAVGWPGMARLVRGQVLSLREEQFVEAAWAIGARPWRVIRYHILPNAMAPIVVSVSMSMGGAIMAEAGLSFMGVGIRPPTPSWGALIFDNYSFWNTSAAPVLLWLPALIVGAMVAAFNFVGDGLNEALSPG